ncbi:MgtC/SapB family protein [Desertifilum tharense IPPAS B-1220]|uniref:MgtC/SapB family protein n=1 Tax=Desertifilum tharense TaxID=1185873 RepID=UPI000AB2D4F1|nr:MULTISPECIES: MgtC/SapB family protein [Desertifilum]
MAGIEPYTFSLNDWLQTLLRLGIAVLVGTVIGLEREIKHKPAGLRTHILVSLGSALFVLTSIQVGDALRSDDALSRIIQGIAAGVGFIGGGEILRESKPDSEGMRVRGLTSAAAIWISAALGVAAGCGLWQLSLTAAAIAFIVLKLFKKLETFT